MIRFLFLISVIGLSACQSSPSYKTVRAPDGKSAREVKCTRYPECYEAAAKICNGKYEIIPNAGQPKPGNVSLLPDGVSILVRCRAN